MVVGGFGSGDLVTLRADTGTLAVERQPGLPPRGRNTAWPTCPRSAAPAGDRRQRAPCMPSGLGGVIAGAWICDPAAACGSGRSASGQHTPWVAGDWLFVPDRQRPARWLCHQPSADGRVRWLSRVAALRQRDQAVAEPDLLDRDRLLGELPYLYCAGSTEKLIALRQPGRTAWSPCWREQDLPAARSPCRRWSRPAASCWWSRTTPRSRPWAEEGSKARGLDPRPAAGGLKPTLDRRHEERSPWPRRQRVGFSLREYTETSLRPV